MLWTELFFSYFPIDKRILWQQMLARFCFLFAVWLTGLLAYSLDGLTMSYVLELHIYPILFGMGILILFGTYMTQRTLSDLIQNVRPILKLDDLQFQKFHERVQRYSCSFLPCLFMAIGLVVFTSGVPSEFQLALSEGFKLHVIWNLFFNFFIYLLTATGIWIFMSIWLAIFLISRQPLSVKLLPKTFFERFRDLSIVALWISLGYFMGISLSIGLTTFSAGAPALSLFEIVVSPNLFFIVIGIIGILLPFYNIHKALLKLKKQELLKISEESEQLLRRLDEVLAKDPTTQISDQTITIMAHLFSLQFKERHIKAAPEWPIDISFLSKLTGLVLIPIISRIAMQIFTQFL
jgi:hypothetical protein